MNTALSVIFLCQAMAVPFIGLAFLFALPLVGFSALVWFGAKALIARAEEFLFLLRARQEQRC